MPLLVSGQGYRTFDSGKVLEATTVAEVRQVYEPVDKGLIFMAADDGSGNLQVYKFDLQSVAAASATVLVPDNPFYATRGRWVLVGTSVPSGGGGVTTGTGSPESVVTASPGQGYIDIADTANPVLYFKITGTGNTGWLNFLGGA